MIEARQLADALSLPLDRAQQWSAPLNAAMSRFEVNTPKRVAAFVAQVAEESACLTAVSENLNYTAQGLLSTFGKYFTPAQAAQYQKKPEAIANRVYANRYGNGDGKSGDGWKYRGRGLIQITFRDNYRACGAGLGLDLETNPDLLTQPDNAALSAGWYWHAHGCNALADASQLVQITRAINGGTNGLAQRKAFYDKALAVLLPGEKLLR